MSPLTRRRLLTSAGASVTTIALGVDIRPAFAETITTNIPDSAFSLGVGSGDPAPDSVVLWTRLAPDPLSGGGMPNQPVRVEWELATDEEFRHTVRRGATIARPEQGHSVHPEPGDLRPDSWYYYRFRVGNQISPVGRTRTLPSRGSHPSAVRFAFASCQNYAHGYYNAQADLARQDVDFVAFLGDYIYESRSNPDTVRVHEGEGEPFTLVEYRNRYAQYRSDPDLQAAHAAFPWFSTVDDHEVDNNWAGFIPQDPDQQSPDVFRARRQAAFQAWYEHMPVRSWSRPRHDRIQISRRFRWGDLATVHVLDTRQYRTDQPSDEEGAADPEGTMLGTAQRRWLFDGLTDGPQQWNVLANQTPMNYMPPQYRTSAAWFDPWDGYLYERRRLMDLFGSGRVANPFVVTGDRHMTMAADLLAIHDDPESPVVASEFVGTSLTSGRDGDSDAWHERWDEALGAVDHWIYGDGHRGYVICDVDRDRLRCSMRTTPIVTVPGQPSVDGERFAVEAGRPGLLPA